MVEGKYLYCILDLKKKHEFGPIGLFDKNAYTLSHKDISAVISSIPFKELQPDINTITAHQRVVEESRNLGTTLPIRFGILFKTEDGIKKMISKSYNEFETKIKNLKDKDEYGLKIIMEKSKLAQLHNLSQETPEIKRIKKEMKESGKGTTYFLKMQMDEAIKNEIYKKIDVIGGKVHQELISLSISNCLLKSDLDQVILNAAYLIDKKKIDIFRKKIEDVKKMYAKYGLMFHLSGPWAPYSFC
jgi:hypothetical protein